MLQPAFYKAFYTIIVFLANLLLANILLPANFGAISLMIVNASIVYLITGLGTDSIIMHSLTNKKWDLPQAVSFTYHTTAVQIAFFLLLETAHFSLWKQTLLNQNNIKLLFGEILYFFGLVIMEKYLVLLYAQHKATLANRLLLLSAMVYMGTLTWMKICGVASFTLLFYLFCLQSFFQGCILLIAFHRNEKAGVSIRIKWRDLHRLFKMSSVVMVTNFIQLLAYRIDFLLLKKFYTAYEVGIYAQANKFANLMWVIPNIFAFLLMPKFRQMDSGKIALVFRYAVLSGLGLLLITIVVTKIFYSYFINPEYNSGLPAFFLMLPGYFCWSVVIYFGAYFSWRGMFYTNLAISSFCFATVLLCDLVFIPEFSIQGAAISNTISYSATLLVCFILFSKETGMGFLKICRPEKSDLSTLSKLFK